MNYPTRSAELMTQPVMPVDEAAAPLVLRARPMKGPVDLEAMLDDIEARFPKTLARLAE